MTMQDRGGTPNEEWVQMYRGQVRSSPSCLASRRAIVDYHGVRDAGMRQLLIDYINQRAALGMDHSSPRGLTGHLARNFWCVIERINPEQHDLDLNEETYEA